MKTDTWFPFYPADYLRDTMFLTNEQHGAYLLLLICCWFAGGVLPDDDMQMANITHVSLDYWKGHLRPTLSRFFVIENGKWRQKRVELEWLKAQHISQVRSEAAAKGKQTASKTEAMAPAKPEQLPVPSQSQSQSPLTGTVTHTIGGSGNGATKAEIFNRAKASLNELFQWDPNTPWDYAEDSRLSTLVSQHPLLIEEVNCLIAGRTKDSRYFPQSISTLLEKWNPTLDRVRAPGYGKTMTKEEERRAAFVAKMRPEDQAIKPKILKIEPQTHIQK